MCFFCPDTPPARGSAKSKGSRGAMNNAIIDKQDNPNQFAVGLKNACCTEPFCCCISACCAPYGCTACWARKAVLDKYHGGMDAYVCCQGYAPKCCCVDFSTCCQGSPCGLCCEGCCCPMMSLSIARMHLMDSKQARPDPCDFQIIACANCLQIIACLLDIIAIFVEAARDIAEIVNLIADLFMCSVAGCMGAQVYHEIKIDKDGIKYHVAQGIPVAQGRPVGAPEISEMER